MGFPVVDEPGGLTGVALAAVGLPLGEQLSPAAVRAAAAIYSGWSAPAGTTPLRGADYGDISADGDVPATFVRAHERLADVLALGAMPLLLGGSPLVTVPALQVLSGKLRGRLGVVAFSPHLDVAVEPGYVPASRWARALELDILAPANLVLIGARPSPACAAPRHVLDGLGAHVFTLAHVEEAGIRVLTQEALEAAAAGTEALYLSVDVSVLGCGADPVGLTVRELVAGVAGLGGAFLAAADVCASAPDGDPIAAARVAAEIVTAAARQRG